MGIRKYNGRDVNDFILGCSLVWLLYLGYVLPWWSARFKHSIKECMQSTGPFWSTGSRRASVICTQWIILDLWRRRIMRLRTTYCATYSDAGCKAPKTLPIVLRKPHKTQSGDHSYCIMYCVVYFSGCIDFFQAITQWDHLYYSE